MEVFPHPRAPLGGPWAVPSGPGPTFPRQHSRCSRLSGPPGAGHHHWRVSQRVVTASLGPEVPPVRGEG